MRLTEIILILLISKLSFGQHKYVGIYKSHFSESVELKADSTFIHNHRFHLSSSWTIGQWKVLNDTIYLTTKLVKDTVRIRDSAYKTINDSLVLSTDKKADRIEFNEYLASQLSSGGQNRIKPPKKLYWKKEKLYRLKRNEKLDLKKVKQFGNNNKYKTYFRKEKE